MGAVRFVFKLSAKRRGGRGIARARDFHRP